MLPPDLPAAPSSPLPPHGRHDINHANIHHQPRRSVCERFLRRVRIRSNIFAGESDCLGRSNSMGRREAQPDAIGRADARKGLWVPARRHRAHVWPDSRARRRRQLRVLRGGERRASPHAEAAFEKTATTRAQIIKALGDSIAYCDAAYAALDDKRAGETIDMPFGMGKGARVLPLMMNSGHCRNTTEIS